MTGPVSPRPGADSDTDPAGTWIGGPTVSSPDAGLDTILGELFEGSTGAPISIVITPEPGPETHDGAATPGGLGSSVEGRAELAWSIDGEAQPPAPLPAVLVQAQHRINLAALAGDPGRLHLHGALLTHDDLVVLIPAVRGSGKTTLAAALMEGGFAYGTDEMVALGPDGRAEPLRKPLNLKAGSLLRVAAARNLRHPALADWPLDGPNLGRPTATMAPGSHRVTHVVFPMRSDDHEGPPVAAAVPAPEAVRLLVENTFDFDRLGPGPALAALAQLVTTANTMSLAYREADDAARYLASEAAPAGPVVVADHPGVDAIDGAVGVRVVGGGVVWLPDPSRVCDLTDDAYDAWLDAPHLDLP